MSSGSTTAPSPGLPLAVSQKEEKSVRRLPLLDQFLADQQDLTAVERFSQFHDKHTGPLQEQHYRKLLPSARPQEGQQYAFEVDLDVCSGCKACVTACHNLNGLEETETWRSVGLLHGGTAEAPVQKTVTTACHHCVDPACMNGCPVQAYEKDPVTGIVKHLDDQCIGCQYCIFTCPYEVPQFSKDKGIVRKCDMCSDRLEEGEAPACVQACPNEAIAIKLVDRRDVLADAQTDQFLPGTPSPGITAPTTTYKTKHAFPRNMRPADFFAVRPAHQHMPLVIMLVLTQLSAGAFSALALLPAVLGAAPGVIATQGIVATVLTMLALGAASAHVGRPLYGFRAVLGIRTSWMSREIATFGLYSAVAAAYAGLLLAPLLPQPVQGLIPEVALTHAPLLGQAVAGVGLFAVFTSVMLYAVTKRQYWGGGRTAFRFYGTALVLGLATTALCTYGYAEFVQGQLGREFIAFGPLIARAIALATIAKLLGEASLFLHLRDKQQGDLKRSAMLLAGELKRPTQARFLIAFFGGVLVPLATLHGLRETSSTLAFVASLVSFLCLLAGEHLERMSFFSALSSPRMPGGLR